MTLSGEFPASVVTLPSHLNRVLGEKRAAVQHALSWGTPLGTPQKASILVSRPQDWRTRVEKQRICVWPLLLIREHNLAPRAGRPIRARRVAHWRVRN